MMFSNFFWQRVTSRDHINQREFFLFVVAFQLREKERTLFTQFIHATIPGYLEEPGFERRLGTRRREIHMKFGQGDIQLHKDKLQHITSLLIIFQATTNKIV